MALLINGRFLTRPVTGVERYGHMLLRVIAEQWPTARILIPGRWQGPSEVHGLGTERVGGLGGHAWEQLQLPRAVGPSDLLLSPANTGPLRVRNQVVVIHDLAALQHPEWFDRRFAAWYGFLLPRLSRRVVRVITVSQVMGSAIEQRFSLDPDRVRVVAPCTMPLGEANRDIHVGGPYLLMVASQDPRKGYADALAWFSRFTDPLFQLVIVGRPGPAFRPIDTRRLPGVIQLTNLPDAQLRTLYEGALALLQPSRYEGFGLPILEAMAHGCPVLATDLPVFRERFGEAIRYVELGSDRSMANALAEVRDPVQRAARIAAGSRKAAEYTLERTARELRLVLAPLLHR